MQAGHALASVGFDFVVDGTGDFDGDGDADLGLHRDVGGNRELFVIELQDHVNQAGKSLGVTGLDWLVG